MDYNSWESFKQFAGVEQIHPLQWLYDVAVRLMFIFNFFYEKEELEHQNHGATTLEWTHNQSDGNWPGVGNSPRFTAGLI